MKEATPAAPVTTSKAASDAAAEEEKRKNAASSASSSANVSSATAADNTPSPTPLQPAQGKEPQLSLDTPGSVTPIPTVDTAPDTSFTGDLGSRVSTAPVGGVAPNMSHDDFLGSIATAKGVDPTTGAYSDDGTFAAAQKAEPAASALDPSGKTGNANGNSAPQGSQGNQGYQGNIGGQGGQGSQGNAFANFLGAALGGALAGRGGRGGYYAQPSRAAYYPQRGAFHPQMPRTVYQPRQIFGGGGGRPSFGGGAPARGGFSGGGRGGRREESVGEEFANEPNPKHADIDYMNMMLAGGLNRPKKTFPKVAKGDNPMQAIDEAVLKNLVSSYQKMINGKDS